ncbi:MAG: hypothetical protein PQJ50_07265, partial [Spirochaetales bacterium]|nr:hypothetical protein [Spirochaetales bacterium]
MDSSNYQREVRIDRINNNVGKAVFANLLMSVLLFFIFSDRISGHPYPAALLLFNIVINLARIVYIRMINSGRLDKFSSAAFAWHHLSILFSSLCWGLLFLHLYIFMDASRILLLLVMLFGMTTGGVINLSSRFFLSVIYFNMILLPLVSYSLIFVDNDYSNHTVMFLIYYFFLLFWS